MTTAELCMAGFGGACALFAFVGGYIVATVVFLTGLGRVLQPWGQGKEEAHVTISRVVRWWRTGEADIRD